MSFATNVAEAAAGLFTFNADSTPSGFLGKRNQAGEPTHKQPRHLGGNSNFLDTTVHNLTHQNATANQVDRLSDQHENIGQLHNNGLYTINETIGGVGHHLGGMTEKLGGLHGALHALNMHSEENLIKHSQIYDILNHLAEYIGSQFTASNGFMQHNFEELREVLELIHQDLVVPVHKLTSDIHDLHTQIGDIDKKIKSSQEYMDIVENVNDDYKRLLVEIQTYSLQQHENTKILNEIKASISAQNMYV